MNLRNLNWNFIFSHKLLKNVKFLLKKLKMKRSDDASVRNTIPRPSTIINIHHLKLQFFSLLVLLGILLFVQVIRVCKTFALTVCHVCSYSLLAKVFSFPLPVFKRKFAIDVFSSIAETQKQVLLRVCDTLSMNLRKKYAPPERRKRFKIIPCLLTK